MTKLRPGTLALVLAASIVGGCAGDRLFAPAEMRNGVMTDWYEHRALYTNSNDPASPTSSVCVSDYCKWQWPPFTPAGGASARGDLTIFKRADGTLQFAYKGKPLYFYVGDTKTGDKTGDGLNNGVWRVVTAN